MQSELNIKYIRCITKKYNIYGESHQLHHILIHKDKMADASAHNK